MRTNNFVKLDFCVIKPYFKTIIFLPIVAVAIGLMMKNVYFTIIMMTAYTWTVSIYPFSVSEKFNLDVMYSALPGSRKQVIRGRFIFFAALYWIAALTSLFLGYGIHLVTGFEFNVFQGFLIVAGIFPFASLIVGMFYSVLFKFGYLKAKMLNIVPIILIYVVGDLIKNLTKEKSIYFPDISPVLMYGLCLLVGFVILYISSKISQRIYANKDF